jgi:hypothetical protein
VEAGGSQPVSSRVDRREMLAVTIEVPKNRDEEYRAARDGIRLLEIAPCRFVMIDGSGPPRDEAFRARMPGLYATAYGLRFALKRRGVPGRVAPLEGLWWTTIVRQPIQDAPERERRSVPDHLT